LLGWRDTVALTDSIGTINTDTYKEN